MLAWTTRTYGLVPMTLMGARSFTGSYAVFVVSGMITICDGLPISSMPVGGRAGDRFHRERTARSRAVLDHELLPKRVAERLRDKTRNAVAIAARREWNEDLDRLLRPNLRACGLTQTH